MLCLYLSNDNGVGKKKGLQGSYQLVDARIPFKYGMLRLVEYVSSVLDVSGTRATLNIYATLNPLKKHVGELCDNTR